MNPLPHIFHLWFFFIHDFVLIHEEKSCVCKQHKITIFLKEYARNALLNLLIMLTKLQL